jgi:hypothetical protein
MSVAAVARTSLALAFAGLLGAGSASAQQGAYAYPNAGQSEAQQAQDRFECHQWAVSQSGFDPSTAPPLPAQPVPPPPSGGYSDQRQQQSGGGMLGIGDGGFFRGGGMMGDAATGAALGAAGGAIAGDAGEGAAIGAVASTLFGALNRATTKPAPAPAPGPSYDAGYQQQQAQAAQAYNQRMQLTGEYNRAFGACMSARNYTVN